VRSKVQLNSFSLLLTSAWLLSHLITLSDAHTHSVGFIWTSDRPVAKTSTWQHTIITRDRHPCPRWNSNPQSQTASGRRITP